MNKKVQIGNRWVGEGEATFIIAEAGINHNGDLAMAKKMIEVAQSSGVDAVKFQNFSAAEFIADRNLEYTYVSKGKVITEPQMEMFKRVELGERETKDLFDFAGQTGITFLSTPSNPAAVDFLCKIGVAAIKIGSDDLTNYPLLQYVASKHKPIILATGMATLGEVEKAVNIIGKCDDEQIILLHCVSSYPAKPEEINLRAMDTLRLTFHLPVGFSDHTEGIEVALAAAARGACVIEKHFTLDKNLPGPDHHFSAEPAELGNLVRCIRKIETALGSPEKMPSDNEKQMIKLVRRSIVASIDIPKGVVITEGMVSLQRPGTGLSADMLIYVIGRKASKTIHKGDILQMEDIG